MSYYRKINLKEFEDYIFSFNKKVGITPGTAVLANKFKVHPKTIRENLKKLNDMGKISYKDTGKYNTKYIIK